jgi:allantoate deiminase
MTFPQDKSWPDMAARIIQRVHALAAISETPDALTRVSFSPEHARAADLILGWMRDAGLAARMDEIGNVIGRLEGDAPGLPALMLGSHYDTVRDAGKWDGPLGLIAALECVAEIAREGARLPFALEVIGFADEEGTRFCSTLLGSRAVAGTFDQAALQAADESGTTVGEAMRRFGLDPAAVPRAARRREDILAYVELHIEQGPVLEAENQPIGVVTAISGATRFNIALEGEAGHAGTVPMGLRRDALAGAAECIAAIERLCAAGEGAAGTVGQIAAEPGAANVIPGRARFSVDLRAPGDELREETVARVLAAVEAIAARRGLIARIVRTHENATAPCAPWLRAQLGEAVAAEGYPIRELPSGAGHDGMAMIDIADIAMLFVRCRRGVSHHPGEHVSDEDVAVSAQVLSRFIRSFRRVPGDRRTD